METIDSTAQDFTTSINTSSSIQTTVSTYQCPTNYQIFMRVMYCYILPCLILFGVIGNSLAFVVFCRQRHDQRGEQTYLLSCLAVVDSFYLLTTIFSRMLPTIAKYHHQPVLFWSIYFRPTAYFCASVGELLASYTLVLVTAHRYLLICHPIKFIRWTSTRKIIMALSCLVTFAIVFYIPRLFQQEVKIRYNSCLGHKYPTLVTTVFGKNVVYIILYKEILRLLIPTLLPVVSQFVLTRKIICHLRSRPEASRKQTMALAYLLVIINIVFISCKLPAWINSFLRSLAHIFKISNKVFKDFRSYSAVVSNMLLSVSSATNFIIYFVCGSKFKGTLKELFPLPTCNMSKKKVYIINGSRNTTPGTTTPRTTTLGTTTLGQLPHRISTPAGHLPLYQLPTRTTTPVELYPSGQLPL